MGSLVVALALLAGNAFFVGAEFAVMSARRSQIEPRAEAGSRPARTVLWAMEHVSLMLACAQLGITVCSTALGAIAEPAIAHLLEPLARAAGLPEAAVHPVALVVALLMVVYLHVVLGEMVPKNLAVAGPERAVMFFGPPLVWISRVVSPIIRFLNWLANAVLHLIGVQPRDEVASAFTPEEVASIVEASRAEGLITDSEGLIEGAIEFSDKTAGDVMIPLDRLDSVPGGTVTPDLLEREVARTGFSRFPVIADGRVIGYLHVKDVLYAQGEDRGEPVPPWRIRPLASVSRPDDIEDVLRAMQHTGAHLALVRWQGRQVGVVFLEDILEELVGEVRDAMQRDR